ncbi:hypothetical protein SDC9_149964 [bioreactor metagenome]|uniref:Uncharacterized protein n=1 Tax=bioreactor metagenome TaxID=1076179 RepID=A0A645EL61_9ZZZZ
MIRLDQNVNHLMVPEKAEIFLPVLPVRMRDGAVGVIGRIVPDAEMA